MSLLVWMGMALVVLQLVELLEAILHGAAIPSNGPNGVSGGALDRLGAAVFSDIGAANALALVLVVALVGAPLAIARRLHSHVSRAVTATLALTVVASVLTAVGSVLAVRVRLHIYGVSGQAITTAVRYSLFSYLISTLGPALIAFAGALAGLRWLRRPAQTSSK